MLTCTPLGMPLFSSFYSNVTVLQGLEKQCLKVRGKPEGALCVRDQWEGTEVQGGIINFTLDGWGEMETGSRKREAQIGSWAGQALILDKEMQAHPLRNLRVPHG